MDVYTVVYADEGLLKQACETLIVARHLLADDLLPLPPTQIIIFTYNITDNFAVELRKIGYRDIRILDSGIIAKEPAYAETSNEVTDSSIKETDEISNKVADAVEKDRETEKDYISRFSLNDFYDHVPVRGYSSIYLMEKILIIVYADYKSINDEITRETAKDLFAGINACSLSLKDAFMAVISSWKGFDIEADLCAKGRFYRQISAKSKFLEFDIDGCQCIAGPVGYHEDLSKSLFVYVVEESGITFTSLRPFDNSLLTKFLVSKDVLFELCSVDGCAQFTIPCGEVKKILPTV